MNWTKTFSLMLKIKKKNQQGNVEICRIRQNWNILIWLRAGTELCHSKSLQCFLGITMYVYKVPIPLSELTGCTIFLVRPCTQGSPIMHCSNSRKAHLKIKRNPWHCWYCHTEKYDFTNSMFFIKKKKAKKETNAKLDAKFLANSIHNCWPNALSDNFQVLCYLFVHCFFVCVIQSLKSQICFCSLDDLNTVG